MKNLIIGFIMTCLLAGCGGGGGEFTSGSSAAASSASSGTSSSSSSVATILSLGNGTGSGFITGQIALNSTSLSAGGSATLSVTLVDQNGVPYAQSATISFTSPCTSLGTARIADGSGNTISGVTTTTGSASVTYVAQGCSGSDVITATTTANNQSLSASGTMTVAAASLGSVVFESASPSNIGLKGTGRQETSTLIFRVVDSTNGPVANADVTFSLSTATGGITLSPITVKSLADGTAQTVVQSGTVATSVRVTATATLSGVTQSTQSSNLTITTGIADQDSFSLAVACSNVEALNYDGVPVSVSVILSDRNNNPVPDNTAITFSSEGGSIGGSCPTTGGTCGVTWTSSNPRPADGRSTILATAIGEESFSDVNGNGSFDATESYSDVGERYRDENENGSYDVGEPFFDFNNNGTRDGPDGFFNGVLCTDANRCSSLATSTGIGLNNLIIMSGSVADNFTIRTTNSYIDGTAPTNDSSAAGITASTGGHTYYVAVMDVNGNPMPNGTTVGFTTDNGTLLGTKTYTVGCTTLGSYKYQGGVTLFPLTIKSDGTGDSGVLIISVTTKGVTTPKIDGTTTSIQIPITD